MKDARKTVEAKQNSAANEMEHLWLDSPCLNQKTFEMVTCANITLGNGFDNRTYNTNQDDYKDAIFHVY